MRALAFFLLLVLAAGLLGVFVVDEQVGNSGYQYFTDKNRQIKRHNRVLRNRAQDPWQYRMLAAWAVEGFLRATGRRGEPGPMLDRMILFRKLQTAAVFLLAGLYYRRLGLGGAGALVGLSLLAWGMTFAYYDSDLSFNVYFDLAFYLLAGLLILHRRDAWVVPLAALAALNRETSLLIPFLLLAARTELRPRPRVDRRTLALAALALALQLAVFFGMRAWLGPKPPFHPHGVEWGLALARYNLMRPVTWHFLFATFSLLPLVALAGVRRWPTELRRFLVALVPAWLAIHLFMAVLAETRLLLVPHALVFVPGAVFAATALHHRARRRATATAA